MHFKRTKIKKKPTSDEHDQTGKKASVPKNRNENEGKHGEKMKKEETKKKKSKTKRTENDQAERTPIA